MERKKKEVEQEMKKERKKNSGRRQNVDEKKKEKLRLCYPRNSRWKRGMGARRKRTGRGVNTPRCPRGPSASGCGETG